MSQPEFQRSQRWIQETQDLPSGPLTPEPASTQPLPQVLPTLFDLVLDSTADTTAATTPRLAAFLEAPTVGKALEVWLDRLLEAGRLPDKQDVSDSLSRDVARLDRLLTEQVNAILHHPKFQQLEAGWRSLEYLVNQVDEDENIKVRVLDVSWAELTRDIDRAIEFDQSQLFKKVYNDEFGTPGGEPFSVLIGNYEIRHRPSREHPQDDLATLTGISQVAAAAFAPFIAAAHPSMLGMDTFGELENPVDLNRTFEQLEYVKWKAFRDTEDSRFVGLCLPRVLMRLPHADDGARVDGFLYREDVEGRDFNRYLWGNAAFAFGSVLVRAFADCRWLADIRGVERDVLSGGMVSGLPVHCFSTDSWGVAPKASTDVLIVERQEKQFSELGLIPLCHLPDTEFSAFFANQSAQKPKTYDEPAATTNARLSAMLQYTLCVSRFAHYVKVLARDKVGGFTEPSDVEKFLHNWLQRYVTSDSDASMETRSKWPLREAAVQVRERPGRPGSYYCVAHLRPHFQLDELNAAVKLVTELSQGTNN